jgi:hypothetical protein
VKHAPETYAIVGFTNHVGDVSLVIVIVLQCLLVKLSCIGDAIMCLRP